MRTHVLTHEIDYNLPRAQRSAVQDAFTMLCIGPSVAAQQHQQYFARESAKQARALIGAFGVRRAAPHEITVEMQERLHAEIVAAVEAKRAAAGGAS
jgi:hypothetical protein